MLKNFLDNMKPPFEAGYFSTGN